MTVYLTATEVFISVWEFKPQLLQLHHLWFVRHMGLITYLQGNRIASLIPHEISLHGQENPGGTKNTPPLNPDQEPGWHQAHIFQLTTLYPMSPSSEAPPHSSSNRIAFDNYSLRFHLCSWCLFPLLWEIPISDQTGLLEVHTFSHWLSTFITFTGWEAITSVRRTLCVILMSGCHLFMWESASIAHDKCEEPFERQEPCVSDCSVSVKVHLLHYEKVQYTWRCKANSVCMLVCVILGVLVDCMPKGGCIPQLCLYLLCLCKSADVAVLTVTVLTRTCCH